MSLLINEDLLKAELALAGANINNVIELGRDYLKHLAEYRDQLFNLRGIPEIDLAQTSQLGRELINQARKAIRSAIELTVSEHNRVEDLLTSFTSINGTGAAETFNRLKFKGGTKWESTSTGVRLRGGEVLTIQKAVEVAELLRREAYITHKITFHR
jgi:hypothetical protein